MRCYSPLQTGTVIVPETKAFGTSKYFHMSLHKMTSVPLPRRICLVAGLCLGLTSAAAAQVPDSLEASDYFPLEVGNVWEYEHQLTRPHTIYRPVDESELRLERYAVLDRQIHGDTIYYSVTYQERSEEGVVLRRDTLRLWYDVQHATLRGGEHLMLLSWPRCLDSAFGYDQSAPGTDCWPFVQKEEYHMPGLFGTELVQAKGFGDYVWAFAAVHGVGIVVGGGGCEPCGSFSDRDEWQLRYARVGGKEYGARIVGTERRNETSDESPLAAYPNPTAGLLVVETPVGASLAVYDLLGRRVHVEPSSPGRLHLDLSGLPAGVYLLSVGTRALPVLVQ